MRLARIQTTLKHSRIKPWAIEKLSDTISMARLNGANSARLEWETDVLDVSPWHTALNYLPKKYFRNKDAVKCDEHFCSTLLIRATFPFKHHG